MFYEVDPGWEDYEDYNAITGILQGAGEQEVLGLRAVYNAAFLKKIRTRWSPSSIQTSREKITRHPAPTPRRAGL